MEYGSIVFVDFDGVMHPVGASVYFCRQKGLHEILEALESLRGKPVGIVVSSSWRDSAYLRTKDGSFDAAQAAEFLGVPVARIVGMTPVGDSDKRGEEIASWRAANPELGRLPWLVLDDMEVLFADSGMKDKALFMDGSRGLDGSGWGAAASCILAMQSSSEQERKAEFSKGLLSIGEELRGQSVQSCVVEAIELLGRALAAGGPQGAAEVALMAARARCFGMSSRLALMGGAYAADVATSELASSANEAAGPCEVELWEALSDLSAVSKSSADIAAIAALSLGAGKGLEARIPELLMSTLGRASAGPMKSVLAESFDNGRAAALPVLEAARRLGWIGQADFLLQAEISEQQATRVYGEAAVAAFWNREERPAPICRSAARSSRI